MPWARHNGVETISHRYISSVQQRLANPPDADQGKAPRPVRTSRTVYIVDDDTQVRMSLAFLLRSMGVNPWPFSGGQDFLDGLDQLQPGVILLDMRMPDPDGLSVLRSLQERKPGWPVIAMTGHGDIRLAVSAMKLDAFDFLEKPMQEEELHRLLESGSRGACPPGEVPDEVGSSRKAPGEPDRSRGACSKGNRRRPREQGNRGCAGHQHSNGGNASSEPDQEASREERGRGCRLRRRSRAVESLAALLSACRSLP